MFEFLSGFSFGMLMGTYIDCKPFIEEAIRMLMEWYEKLPKKT